MAYFNTYLCWETYNYLFISILAILLLVDTGQSIDPQAFFDNSQDSSNDFIQTNSNSKYFMNNVPVDFSSEDLSSLGIGVDHVSYIPIKFEPQYLDFHASPIGQPNLKQVKLVNKNTKKSIHLLSISADTPHFHCSIFHDKILLAGDNTTFDIVFLPREPGNVENTFFVHTSSGTYRYQVFGIGIPSAYRLESFLGATIPINASYSPYVTIYNPHNVTMQITEMYTSGGDLHLELPKQYTSTPRDMWQVPAYQTRRVMRLRLWATREANTTAYLRMRHNLTTDKHGFVIPISVQVSSNPGIYSLVPILDFGILHMSSKPITLTLSLVNSHPNPIMVENVRLSRSNAAISITFKPVRLSPGVQSGTVVAFVTFHSAKFMEIGQSTGKLIVITDFQEKQLVIPFKANMHNGSLHHDVTSVRFFLSKASKGAISRRISFRNTFNFTLAVYNVSLDASSNPHFKLSKFQSPSFIRSRQNTSFFEVKFLSSLSNSLQQFSGSIILHSNISQFVVPIFVYDGKLTIVSQQPQESNGSFQLGTLGIKETRYYDFKLYNKNPLEVSIRHIALQQNTVALEFFGLKKDNRNDFTLNQEPTVVNRESWIKIPAYYFAIFRLKVKAPDTIGVFTTNIKMETQFENLSIDFIFQTAEGSFSAVPETLLLEDSFPGKLTVGDLTVESTFLEYMELKSVTFLGNTTSFHFDPSPGRQLPMLLKPGEKTPVGRLVLDPSASCTKSPLEDLSMGDAVTTDFKTTTPCYLGFDAGNGNDENMWVSAFSLPASVSHMDQGIVLSLRSRWENLLASQGGSLRGTTIVMDSATSSGFLSTTQASLVWPSIISADHQPQNNPDIDFESSSPVEMESSSEMEKIKWPLVDSQLVDMGLTQLGNTTVRELVIHNPSDFPLVVQALPLARYPVSYQMLTFLGQEPSQSLVDVEDVFHLESGNLSTSLPPDLTPPLISPLQHPEGTVGLVLPPRTSRPLRLLFRPSRRHRVNSLLLLRNNLTGLEVVRVTGRAEEGHLLFANTTPEEVQPLVFELTEKHLRNCEKSMLGKGVVPNFTVRRPFVIHNVGQLRIFIRGFSFGPDSSTDIALLPTVDTPPEEEGSPPTPLFDAFHIHSAWPSTTSLVNCSSFFSPVLCSSLLNWFLAYPFWFLDYPADSWCSGYGFRVEECGGFELGVNASRKISITFTPDFSLHRVHQQLRVHTSLGSVPLNISVLATLPPHMLHRCSQVLVRPDIEIIVWYGLLVLAILLTACVVLLAYCEADSIFTRDVLHRQHLIVHQATTSHPSTSSPPAPIPLSNTPHSSWTSGCGGRILGLVSSVSRTLLSTISLLISSSSNGIHTVSMLPSKLVSSTANYCVSSKPSSGCCACVSTHRPLQCQCIDNRCQVSQRGPASKLPGSSNHTTCGSVPVDAENRLPSFATQQQRKMKKKRGYFQGVYHWGRGLLNLPSNRAAFKPKLVTSSLQMNSSAPITSPDAGPNTESSFSNSVTSSNSNRYGQQSSGSGATSSQTNSPASSSPSAHNVRRRQKGSTKTPKTNPTESQNSPVDDSPVTPSVPLCMPNFAPIDIPQRGVPKRNSTPAVPSLPVSKKSSWRRSPGNVYEGDGPAIAVVKHQVVQSTEEQANPDIFDESFCGEEETRNAAADLRWSPVQHDREEADELLGELSKSPNGSTKGSGSKKSRQSKHIQQSNVASVSPTLQSVGPSEPIELPSPVAPPVSALSRCLPPKLAPLVSKPVGARAPITSIVKPVVQQKPQVTSSDTRTDTNSINYCTQISSAHEGSPTKPLASSPSYLHTVRPLVANSPRSSPLTLNPGSFETPSTNSSSSHFYMHQSMDSSTAKSASNNFRSPSHVAPHPPGQWYHPSQYHPYSLRPMHDPNFYAYPPPPRMPSVSRPPPMNMPIHNHAPSGPVPLRPMRGPPPNYPSPYTTQQNPASHQQVFRHPSQNHQQAPLQSTMVTTSYSPHYQRSYPTTLRYSHITESVSRLPGPPEASSTPPTRSRLLQSLSAAQASAYELPRITQDRRQSMLEYERRCQQQGGLVSPAHLDPRISRPSNAEPGPPRRPDDSSTSLRKLIFDDIEPGSSYDQVANNLLPPDLLCGDSLASPDEAQETSESAWAVPEGGEMMEVVDSNANNDQYYYYYYMDTEEVEGINEPLMMPDSYLN